MRWLICVVGLAASTMLAPVALGVDTIRLGAPAPSVYTDPPGDAGPGPDITNTTVSNDEAGNVTFRIEIPNRPTFTPTMLVFIDIDADRNPATGDSFGSDYSIGFLGGAAALAPYNGSMLGTPTIPASLTGSYVSGVLTVTINVAELGGTASFLFWVGASDNFEDPANFDPAPDLFLYSYNLVFEPDLAGIVPPAQLLKTVKPGKVLKVKGFKARLDDGRVVAPSSISCVLKIAGKVLAPTGNCKWKIPITAAGKRITLIVTLTFDDDKMTKTYSGKVAKA